MSRRRLTPLVAALALLGQGAADAAARPFQWGPVPFITDSARQLLADVPAPDLAPASPAATLPTVPKAPCRDADKPETGLQGQVPLADRLSGRAAEGYSCNLSVVGSLKSFAFTSLDTYGDCAYYGDATTTGGVIVADISDPAHPVKTDYLTTDAMKNPWESLRVHAGRGLLVADRGGVPGLPYLDVYDVRSDCRHPKLLASATIEGAQGHEGWFSADGMTWYMTNGTAPGRMTVIDISDPHHPRKIIDYDKILAPHGGSTSPDGNRTYVCQQSNFQGNEARPDAMVVLDSSQIQARVPSPQLEPVAMVPFPDNTWCQAVHRVTYSGHEFLIQYGERTPLTHTNCTNPQTPQYAYPRIFDNADETEPQLVTNLWIEVDDPANCAITAADANVVNAGMDDADRQSRQSLSQQFKYDVHHCSPDRLVDPTLLACSYFNGGVRVFDIRDPKAPREAAYFNVGTVGATDPTIDMSISRPVILASRGLVVWTSSLGGLHLGRLAPGVIAPAALNCPTTPDSWFDHYNPGACST
jgi:hypothetical protein